MIWKFIGVVILLLVLYLFLVVLAGGRPNIDEVKNYPPDGNQIVALGDSLVSGVGAETPGGFITMLSDDLDLEIVNLGRGGDTTKDGLDRIEEIFRYEPDIVILLLGGNDFLIKTSRDEVFSNLRVLISKIQEKGSIVLLLGVRGGLITDSYDNEFEQLAEESKSAFVPNVLDGLIGNPELMDDIIHPNEDGYRVIADKVSPVLEELLGF